MAGLGLGSGVLRFVKQRLQGFMTVPLPDTSAFLSLSGSPFLPWLVTLLAHFGADATTRSCCCSQDCMQCTCCATVRWCKRHEKSDSPSLHLADPKSCTEIL